MILGPLGYGPSTLPLRHSAIDDFNAVSFFSQMKKEYGSVLSPVSLILKRFDLFSYTFSFLCFMDALHLLTPENTRIPKKGKLFSGKRGIDTRRRDPWVMPCLLCHSELLSLCRQLNK